MRLKVELFVDLDAVAVDADGALGWNAQRVLYDRLEWFRLTAKHVLGGAAPLVLRAARDGTAAWLFLLPRPGKRAEPYGSWYTLRFAPIFAGDPDMAGKRLLLAEIARVLRRRVGRVSLYPLDAESADLTRVGFEAAGWLTRRSEQTINWVAHTAERDFATYWKARPGRLRNTVQRKAVKAGLELQFFYRFDEDAWRDYEHVFAASWKGAEGSPAFLRALARQAGEWGTLRMAIARDTRGMPLAAQFWTVDGDIATIHKLAYVDAAKALSPGSVLSQAMFAHVIDKDRPALINFGTGDDAYKADWMDERRPLYRFEAYDPHSVRGLAAYARAQAAALVAELRTA